MNKPKLDEIKSRYDEKWHNLRPDDYGKLTRAEIAQMRMDIKRLLRMVECAPLPDNKALTVEELRGMDGEPVWCLECECWALVWLYVDTPFLRFNDGSQASSHPALSYTIFRRPPEKGE